MIDRYWLGDDWTVIWEVMDGRNEFELCREKNKLSYVVSGLTISNKNYLEDELRKYNERKMDLINESSNIKWSELDKI